ncbi:MAG: phosphate acyltransferase PlsX [Armatimonadota bacterium]
MRIAVDAMGGDHAPAAVVEGAALAADALYSTGDAPHAQLCLVGDPQAIEAELRRHRVADGFIAIEPASQVVGMHEAPTRALRKKRQSSLAVAVDLVAAGEADAVVSAGNTGAFMAMASTKLKLMPGIERAAIAALLPSAGGRAVLVDAGASVDCKPKMLAQFGLMGNAYAQRVLGLESPRVGLLNIGEEAVKGSETVKAAHELLQGSDLNFIGNVEANYIFSGGADVVVCDGFVGNVALKAAEGVCSLMVDRLQRAFRASLRTRLAAFLGRPALAGLGKMADYAEYGGALLVGVNGICIIGHGRSAPKAFMNAIDLARRSVETEVLTHIGRSHAALADA